MRVMDRRTDRQTELVWHIRAVAYMLSRVKTLQIHRLQQFRVRLSQQKDTMHKIVHHRQSPIDILQTLSQVIQ